MSMKWMANTKRRIQQGGKKRAYKKGDRLLGEN